MKKENEKRKALIVLSNSLFPYVDNGTFDNINKALVAFYKDENNQVFKKFGEWKREQKKIIKGSKAFFVWAKPLKAQKRKEEDKKDVEPIDYEHYPICYLFSNSQVE